MRKRGAENKSTGDGNGESDAWMVEWKVGWKTRESGNDSWEQGAGGEGEREREKLNEGGEDARKMDESLDSQLSKAESERVELINSMLLTKTQRQDRRNGGEEGDEFARSLPGLSGEGKKGKMNLESAVFSCLDISLKL